jgi:glycosyltransferase involved in cell wall biosynthesis
MDSSHPPVVAPAARWSFAAVIPVHNRGELVRRAIESVLAQTRRPEQLIVVDDGSTDDLTPILDPYGTRVTLVRKEHGGVSSARNLGVEAADADFVAFLDSDDHWTPDHLERLEQAITATDGRASLYFADIHLPHGRGGRSAWEVAQFRVDGRFHLCEDGTDWVMLPRQPMWIQASAIRRSEYIGAAGCDERLTRRQDTHLFFKLGIGRPVCAVAGIAGIVTDDDPQSLTQIYAHERVYWECTVCLYRDILANSQLSLVHRAALNRRLAAAHWELARIQLARAPITSARNIAQSLRHDRSLISGRALGRLQTLTRTRRN